MPNTESIKLKRPKTKKQDQRDVLFENVRVRIAPAPTGFLHIGTARTALFNYLFAKKYGGKFIVRIEDTDPKRTKKEYEKNILEGLKWLGLKYDEGPDMDGEYGPYRQSERLNIYENYLKRFLQSNQAYYCFCSEEELEARRQYQMSRGESPRYSGKCRNLSKEEVEKNLKEKRPAIIRFKVPQSQKITFKDLIRGEIEIDTTLMGDIVIARDLRMPLYNFAVVVDDFEMKISHVIRGEDHISNTPKQILLQKALNIPQPHYAHLPLILGPDRAKLSKRHGATALSDFKKEGYLSEAVINFLVFLGWNPGNEREIYSMPSLIKDFSLEKCQKGGAVFNIKRLEWINGFYIRNFSLENLTEKCLPYLLESKLLEETEETIFPKLFPTQKNEIPKEYRKYKIKETEEVVNFEWISKIVALYQERLKKLSEITKLTDFFFQKKLKYDGGFLKWKNMTDQEISSSLDKIYEILSGIEKRDFVKDEMQNKLLIEADNFSQKILKDKQDRGYMLWPFRVALTGKKASAGPFEVAEVLGRERALERVKRAQEILRK